MSLRFDGIHKSFGAINALRGVSFEVASAMGGWNAPAVEPWLENAMHASSRTHFGREAMFMGTGGSIPFMGMLGERFPRTQFLVTGVLGPHSNAHGPNEFLDIATAQKVTACTADILAEVASDARRPGLVVGFAAETNDVATYARDKLVRKRLDLICANRVGVGATGFESDDNALLVLGHDGFERALGPASKTELAALLLDLIAERLP